MSSCFLCGGPPPSAEPVRPAWTGAGMDRSRAGAWPPAEQREGEAVLHAPLGSRGRHLLCGLLTLGLRSVPVLPCASARGPRVGLPSPGHGDKQEKGWKSSSAERGLARRSRGP